MWRRFRDSILGKTAILILIIGLCHPLGLAAEGDNKKSGDSANDKKAASNATATTASATTVTASEMAEIMRRLEQAEIAAAAARDSAAAANARATELEHQVNETRQRLNETEAELKRVKLQAFAQDDKTKPAAQGDQTAQGEQPAQETDQSSEPEVTLSSLNDKVTEMKETIDIHETRLRDSSRTNVETGEHFSVKLNGTLLFNTYYNTAGTDDPPTGLYLLGRKNITLDNGSNFGATIRQTQLGFSFHAPQIGRWRLSGDLQLDFFGGNPPVYNGRAFSPLRLRIARARLESGRLAIVVGQDDPIISPLNPTSLAQVGFPALAESGNLWSWTPQAKVAYRLLDKERQRVTIEGGILAPYNGQTNRSFEFETRPDAGERGRLPAFETRLSYARGDLSTIASNAYLAFDPQPFQVGLGFHYSRQLAVPSINGQPGATINAAAVAGDYVIPIGSKMTLTGELFWGRSLGGLGGGVVQGIVFPIYGKRALGVRSRGGWAQLQVRPVSNIAMHFAYGLDDPYNQDLAGTRFDLAGATSRAANRTFSANMLWRFRSNFIISTEYRFMQTYFIDEPSRSNNHINIGFAYLF